MLDQLRMKGNSKNQYDDHSENISYSLPQFWFGSPGDVLLTLVGLLTAMLSGFCVPGVVILYGDLAEVFVQYQIMAEIKHTNGSQEDPVGYRRLASKFKGTPEELAKQIMDFAILSALLGIAQLVFTSVFVTCLNHAAMNQSVRAREAHFKALLHQRIAWFDSQNSEELASKSIRDVSYLQAGLGEKLGMFVSSTVAACSCILVALYYGSKLAGILLTIIPVITAIMYAAKQINQCLKKQVDTYYKLAETIVEESLLNIRSVSAYSGETHECKKYVQRLSVVEDCEVTRGTINGVFAAILWALMYCMYGLAFWYGVELLRIDQSYTVASLIVIFFCVQIGVLHILQLPQYLYIIAKSNAASRKVINIVTKMPRVTVDINLDVFSMKTEQAISFSNVTFSYSSNVNNAVLKGLEFNIRVGNSMALIGGPNSGKTTCMALIHKFYDPQIGTIRLDGVNIKYMNLAWLRTYIGYAQQSPVLFGATLEECITCNSAYKGQLHMETVAKLVGIHSFIIGLPEKYNTPLTRDLSVDQRQRLALARVLYRKPHILMMDNALSALSSEAEETIYSSVKLANQNLTIIVVTNNLATLRKVGNILYLHDGAVEEFSTIDELIRIYSDVKELICDRSECTDDIDLDSVIKCKYNKRNTRSAIPCTPSFLGRSYQELFRTELVRIGRYPVFFQVTDIPTTDNILRRDVVLAGMMKLLFYNRNEWLQLLLAGVAAVILGFSLPIYAVLFGETLSLIAMYNGVHLQMRLNFFTHMFLVAGFVSGICTIIQGYMVSVAGCKLTTRIRKYAFKRILQQNMEWFDCDTNDLCKICTLLRINAQKIQQACGQKLVYLIQAITSLIVSVALSMIYNWRLGLATFVFTPLSLLALRFNNKLLLEQTFSMSANLSKVKEIISEAVVNIRCVAALTLEEAFLDRYREELDKIVVSHRGLRLRASVHGCCVALPGMAYAVAMFYGGYMLKNNEIEIGKVFKVAEAIILGTLMVGQLVSFTPNIMKAQISAVKLLKIIQNPTCPTSKKHKKQIGGSITFKDVAFQHPHYSGVPKLLSFNVQINSGETVAFVGLPHSGISIPLQLLLYFYKPTCGDIFLDGERWSNMNPNTVKEQLGLIDGDPIFFQRSVADNIAYGDLLREVRMDEIIAAAKAAFLHDYVVSLPDGYKTILYRSQINFTTSQKIRLALARALIRNPKILLFENLQLSESEDAEKILRKAFRAASVNRTCIASSHDPFSVTRIFSRLIVIHRGYIVETGTHEQLRTTQGHYADLCNEIGNSLELISKEGNIASKKFVNVSPHVNDIETDED